MLTAVFKLVWNHRKLHGQSLLSTKVRCFFTEKVLVKLSE